MSALRFWGFREYRGTLLKGSWEFVASTSAFNISKVRVWIALVRARLSIVSIRFKKGW